MYNVPVQMSMKLHSELKTKYFTRKIIYIYIMRYKCYTGPSNITL